MNLIVRREIRRVPHDTVAIGWMTVAASGPSTLTGAARANGITEKWCLSVNWSQGNGWWVITAYAVPVLVW